MVNKKKIFIFLALLVFLFSNPLILFAENSESKKKAKTVRDIKEERRILVVEIYAKWCPVCKNIEPILDLLIKDVPDIKLIQLDVSTREKADASQKISKNWKIEDYYLANKSNTGTVAIILQSTGEVIAEFYNNDDLEKYKTAIQIAKTKEKALESEKEKK